MVEKTTTISLPGDPMVYRYLERTGLFPHEAVPNYDCKAKAVTAAITMYEKSGELSKIYNVLSRSGRPQTYWVYQDKPYCYPITWHNKEFREFDTVKQLEASSWTGDISAPLVADAWYSITGDERVWMALGEKGYKPGQVTVGKQEGDESNSIMQQFLLNSMDFVVRAALRDRRFPSYFKLRSLAAEYKNKAI